MSFTAGADEKHMRELLSVEVSFDLYLPSFLCTKTDELPSPQSPITRFMRDDTTVKVVFFNERPTNGVASSTPPKSWTSLFWRRTDD